MLQFFNDLGVLLNAPLSKDAGNFLSLFGLVFSLIFLYFFARFLGERF